ncbi:murein transglycosylase [Idiomarina xiamenensis]|uniref:murein transglycosylase n=1 Tax=Idiomarina xiamenensis TaxID=1207041 RepID=UPI00031AA662|nr:murein transglycosylase [Idiomarina xiamenensis]
MKVFVQALLIFSCMVSFTAVADSDSVQFDSEPYSTEQAAIRGQQRALFEKAEYAAKRGRMLEYQRLLQQLDDYPLTPYLELIRLQRVGYLANEDRVVAFLEQYQGSPLDWQLRGRWLDYLAKKDEGERFLRDFRQPGSTEHQCLYLTYQHQQGIDAATFNTAVKNLWLHGESLPSECDPVFALWREQQQLTPALVWQRIQLAAEGGSHSLIPYLQGLLPEPQRYLADRYYEVRRDPSQVSHLQRYPGQFPEQEAEIITYALRRLIWRDPDLALETFKQAARKVAFSYEQRQRIYDAFAVALSVEEHPQALVWQQRIPPENLSERVLQWRLAELLRQQDYAGLLQLIGRLPSTVQQGNIWRYWRARALEQEGDPLAAQGLFMDLADERHYYGFLAAAWLKQPVSLAQDPIQVAPTVLRKIVNMPAAQRAYEFLQLERPVAARREWQYLLSQLSVSEQQAAAIVANQWGWHDQAIFGLAQAGYYDAVKIRFPLAYYDDLRRGAEQGC